MLWIKVVLLPALSVAVVNEINSIIIIIMVINYPDRRVFGYPFMKSSFALIVSVTLG
jgi:hypothetical protein